MSLVTFQSSLELHPRLADWVQFQSNGRVSIFNGKVEIGQGIAIAIAQIAAEELELPLECLDLVSGDTAFCPNEWWTSNSRSIEVGGEVIRAACAEVRHAFSAAAARRLGVAIDRVALQDGRFSAATSDVRPSYWDLLGDVDMQQPVTGLATPKPASAYRLVGNSVPRRDLPAKLSGAAYVHDIQTPGLWHGRILRPPSSGAQLLAIDMPTLQASAPGVQVVVDGRFIGLVAEREEDAVRAVQAARAAVEWALPADLPPPGDVRDWLHELPRVSTEISARQGAAPAGPMALSASYSKPYIAHASIGPACAVADFGAQGLTVWSHTQGNFVLRAQLAEALALPQEMVRVIHRDGAGCYGHNGADDAALDAALLSRATRRPVRVVWSREEELSSAPFGPAMTMELSARVATGGQIVDWRHQVWSMAHLSRPGWGDGVGLLAAWHLAQPFAVPQVTDPPLALGGGGDRNAIPIYDFPSQSVVHHHVPDGPLRTSALRALGGFGNVFAIESFMDEIAHQAGIDPLQLRLQHLSDERGRAVLQRVAEAAAAAPPAPEDGQIRGRGLGFARYKNSAAYCAVLVEVSVGARLRVERAWAAVDAGLVVNADGLVNQIEGGIVQAISWTLLEEVKWDRQQVLSRSWDDYPILPFSEVPAIEVTLIRGHAHPSAGAGECAAGPTAAAIGNALFAAIGVRVRDLPMTPERIAQAM
jgi:CO/xanthine dehydrogenase Mo-binding subunit